MSTSLIIALLIMRAKMSSKEVYQVESVIDKKHSKKKLLYLVKWKDYPVEDSTWETKSTLKYCQDVIDQFEKEWKKRPKKRSEIDYQFEEKGEFKEKFKGQMANGSKKMYNTPKKQQVKIFDNRVGRKKSQPIGGNLSFSKIDASLLTTQISGQKITQKIFSRSKADRVISQTPQLKVIEPEEEGLHQLTELPQKKLQYQKRGRLNGQLRKLLTNKDLPLSSSEFHLKIRRLESDKEQNSDIFDYLVEDENGGLQVMSSADMILGYPLQFVNYLQQKTKSNN